MLIEIEPKRLKISISGIEEQRGSRVEVMLVTFIREKRRKPLLSRDLLDFVVNQRFTGFRLVWFCRIVFGLIVW